jgi:hypothetical protein
LGEDVWAELLALVEEHFADEASTCQEPAGEEVGDRQDEMVEAEPSEADGRYHRALEAPDILIESRQGQHWPKEWDEDRIWGDLSPEERRRLNRLLGR